MEGMLVSRGKMSTFVEAIEDCLTDTKQNSIRYNNGNNRKNHSGSPGSGGHFAEG